MNIEKKASIIIPAFNEEKVIEYTLANLNFNWIKEIIVVNDGSIDDTLPLVIRFARDNDNIKIVNLKKNRGKGYAISKGLEVISGDPVVLIDADLGVSVKEIDKLVQPVLNKECEITIAVISITGGGLGCVRKLAHWGLQSITGQTMKAPLSGQRVFSRESIEEMLPLTSGFGLEMGMDIEMLRKGISFEEIDCNLQHKYTGHSLSGYLHRWQQFRQIAKVLWEKRNRK